MNNFILITFNSFHPRLQLEMGGNSINFLDVTIINNNNYLELDWYRKPTFSIRYLNYLSSHPISHKKGIIMDMLDRAMLFSDPQFHYGNIKFIICTLLNNNPRQNLFLTWSIKYWFNKNFSNNVSNHDTISDRVPWFLLYIDSTSEKFLLICKDTNIKLVFSAITN